MSQGAAERVHEVVDAVYRDESRRVFATLIRLLGDFDLAEEALHDAFRAALEQWPRDGVPANPRAWLVSAGRFKAIDAIRRRARFEPGTRYKYNDVRVNALALAALHVWRRPLPEVLARYERWPGVGVSCGTTPRTSSRAISPNCSRKAICRMPAASGVASVLS